MLAARRSTRGDLRLEMGMLDPLNPDTVAWARTVEPRFDPHGLVDLENHLLSASKANKDRWDAKTSLSLKMWGVSALIVATIVLLMPLGAWQGSGEVHTIRGGSHFHSYDPVDAYRHTAIAFWIGLAALALGFASTVLAPGEKRYQSAALMVLAGVDGVIGLIVLAIELLHWPTYPGSPILHVVPVLGLVLLAAAVIVVHSKRKANPYDGRFEWERVPQQHPAMLRERAAALEVLQERRLLDASVPLEALNRRPLGRLDQPGEAE